MGEQTHPAHSPFPPPATLLLPPDYPEDFSISSNPCLKSVREREILYSLSAATRFTTLAFAGSPRCPLRTFIDDIWSRYTNGELNGMECVCAYIILMAVSQERMSLTTGLLSPQRRCALLPLAEVLLFVDVHRSTDMPIVLYIYIYI